MVQSCLALIIVVMCLVMTPGGVTAELTAPAPSALPVTLEGTTLEAASLGAIPTAPSSADPGAGLQVTTALMSPKCDEARVRELAGGAVVAISPQDWGSELKGFNVTLDTAKMDLATLSKKMFTAGCF